MENDQPVPAYRARRLKKEQTEKNMSLGCSAIFIFGAFYGLHQCTRSEPPTDAEITALAEATAAKRQKGFHCLSGWDGSNSSMVRQVQASLRDPDSFEHIDTLITPVNTESGKHGLTMTYRARNGFGGMNVGRAIAEVDPDSCNAENVILGE
jgi:hypothetical protein